MRIWSRGFKARYKKTTSGRRRTIVTTSSSPLTLYHFGRNWGRSGWFWRIFCHLLNFRWSDAWVTLWRKNNNDQTTNDVVALCTWSFVSKQNTAPPSSPVVVVSCSSMFQLIFQKKKLGVPSRLNTTHTHARTLATSQLSHWAQAVIDSSQQIQLAKLY